MNYMSDYRRMVDGKYIEYELLQDMDQSFAFKLKDRIDLLTKDLDKEDPDTPINIMSVLRSMTELACIKSVLEMKVSVNELSDAKDKDRKYLQAKGSVSIDKSRTTASFYLGPSARFEHGKKDPLASVAGRTEVIKRVLNSLINTMGL